MRRSSRIVASTVAFGAWLAAGAPVALAQGTDAGGEGTREGLGTLVAALFVAVVTLFLSIWLAMFAIRTAVGMFDRWTKDIDEMEELKKGNIAVGILLAAVVFSISNIIGSGVISLTTAIKAFSVSVTYAVGVIIGVVNLLVSLAVATFAVSLTFRFLDKFTKEVDEMGEIKKGNVAMAIFMAGVLISVSYIVQAGVGSIAAILEAERIVKALRAG